MVNENVSLEEVNFVAPNGMKDTQEFANFTIVSLGSDESDSWGPVVGNDGIKIDFIMNPEYCSITSIDTRNLRYCKYLNLC